MEHQQYKSKSNPISNLEGDGSKPRVKWVVEYHFYLADNRWDASSVEAISSCPLFDWSPKHPGYLSAKCSFFAQGPLQALKKAKCKAKAIQEDFKQWPLDDYQLVRLMADFSNMVMDRAQKVEVEDEAPSA